jgi:O-antigen/teichoic acid export membrane protein
VRVPVFSAVSGCLVGLALVALLGQPFGATGVGVAYLLGTGISASGPLIGVWRLYSMPWLGPVTRSVAVVASALAAGLLLNGADNPWLDISVALLAFMLAVVVLGRDILRVLPSRVVRRLPLARLVSRGES